MQRLLFKSFKGENMKKIISYTCFIILLLTGYAQAVTLINNTASTQKYTLHGKSLGPSFAPSESRAVMYYSDNANLTVDSDSPYYNRLNSITEVTGISATATDVTISLDTDYVIIFHITSTIDVFIQDEANTPAELQDWTSTDAVIEIPAKGKFNNIAIIGTGSCSVYQYVNID